MCQECKQEHQEANYDMDYNIQKYDDLKQVLYMIVQKKFDEMFSCSRLYNSAGTMACRPVLIHVILVSIIFEHYKQLTKIVGKKIRDQILAPFDEQ